MQIGILSFLFYPFYFFLMVYCSKILGTVLVGQEWKSSLCKGTALLLSHSHMLCMRLLSRAALVLRHSPALHFTCLEGMLSLSKTFPVHWDHHLILVLTPFMCSLNLLTIHVGSSLYFEWRVFDYGVFLNTFSNLVCILLRTLASVFIREIRPERSMLLLGFYLVLYQ